MSLIAKVPGVAAVVALLLCSSCDNAPECAKNSDCGTGRTCVALACLTPDEAAAFKRRQTAVYGETADRCMTAVYGEGWQDRPATDGKGTETFLACAQKAKAARGALRP